MGLDCSTYGWTPTDQDAVNWSETDQLAPP